MTSFEPNAPESLGYCYQVVVSIVFSYSSHLGQGRFKAEPFSSPAWESEAATLRRGEWLPSGSQSFPHSERYFSIPAKISSFVTSFIAAEHIR